MFDELQKFLPLPLKCFETELKLFKTNKTCVLLGTDCSSFGMDMQTGNESSKEVGSFDSAASGFFISIHFYMHFSLLCVFKYDDGDDQVYLMV